MSRWHMPSLRTIQNSLICEFRPRNNSRLFCKRDLIPAPGMKDLRKRPTVSNQQYQKPNFKDQLAQTTREQQRSRIINMIFHIARHMTEEPEKSLAGTVIILVQENRAGLLCGFKPITAVKVGTELWLQWHYLCKVATQQQQQQWKRI